MNPKPKTVLVVDDDLDLLSLVSFLLESEGYAVQTAEEGRQALDIVEHKMPDLILLDMKMPVMNGWEFAGEYKARFSDLAPIVVLTAYEDARRRAEEIGAVTWIGKPFDLDHLLEVVARYIKQ